MALGVGFLADFPTLLCGELSILSFGGHSRLIAVIVVLVDVWVLVVQIEVTVSYTEISLVGHHLLIPAFVAEAPDFKVVVVTLQGALFVAKVNSIDTLNRRVFVSMDRLAVLKHLILWLLNAINTY